MIQRSHGKRLTHLLSLIVALTRKCRSEGDNFTQMKSVIIIVKTWLDVKNVRGGAKPTKVVKSRRASRVPNSCVLLVTFLEARIYLPIQLTVCSSVCVAYLLRELSTRFRQEYLFYIPSLGGFIGRSTHLTSGWSGAMLGSFWCFGKVTIIKKPSTKTTGECCK